MPERWNNRKKEKQKKKKKNGNERRQKINQRMNKWTWMSFFPLDFHDQHNSLIAILTLKIITHLGLSDRPITYDSLEGCGHYSYHFYLYCWLLTQIKTECPAVDVFLCPCAGTCAMRSSFSAIFLIFSLHFAVICRSTDSLNRRHYNCTSYVNRAWWRCRTISCEG